MYRLPIELEKITLIQDIAQMLKEDSDTPLLQHLTMAAEAADPRYPGPTEAYEAANQLQTLFEKENG